MVDRKLAQRGKETSNRNYSSSSSISELRKDLLLLVYCRFILSAESLALVFIDFVEEFHLSVVIVVW